MPLLKRRHEGQSADGFSRNCIIHTVILLLLTCQLKRSILTTSNTMYNRVVAKQERFAVEAGEGVCDLVMDSSKTRWRNYTQSEHSDFDEVAACVNVLRSNVSGLPSPDKREMRKLECNTDVTLANLRNAIQRYDTIWFIGDSVLRQQFYSLICMMDPSLGKHAGKPFNLTGENYESLVWHHSNQSQNGTTLRYSQFGWHFDTSEYALYRDDFPTAVKTLGSNDAIVLNAGMHYDSSRVHFLAKAVNFMANMSTQSTASVFYMEPLLEEWPTSNGFFTNQCECMSP